MTSQSSSINNSSVGASEKRAHAYGFGALLVNTLRRHWTTGLLISIIMFFAFPVVVLAAIGAATEDYGRYDFQVSLEVMIRNNMLDWSSFMRVIMIPALSILAVVMACIMLKYLHNRISVDFYHSLPIKREKLLGVNLLAGYLLLIVPFIVMLTISGVIIAVNGAFCTNLLFNMWLMVAESVVYSLVFYSLSALVGVVSGLTSVQLLLTAVAIFIIPALYLTVLYFINLFSKEMWIAWYTSERLTSLLSPVVDFFWNTGDLLRIDQYIAYILAAAVLFALTYIVYRRYRSERAGSSVIFPIVGTVVKYMVMVLMTLLVGMFFHLLMENYVWLVFGMICGAVLTFMLSNTIINKSAKAMFLGIKGLAIFAGAVALVTVVFITNLFGVNTNLPTSVSKVEVTFDTLTDPIVFRDKEVIEAIRKLYDEGERRRDRNYGKYSSEYSSYYYNNDELSLSLVFYPTVGVPNAKYVTVSNISEFADELRLILDSAEFRAGYIETVESIADDGFEDYIWNYNGLRVSFKDGKANRWVEHYKLSEDVIVYATLKAALLSDAANIGFDSFQTQTIGYFNLRTESGHRDLNVTLGMDAIYELIQRAGWLNVPADELVDNYAGSVEELKVIHLPSGNTEEFTKPAEIREIVGAMESVALESWNRCELTLKEGDYVIQYVFRVDDGEQTDVTDRESAFLLGRVPDFVSAAFAD